MYTAYHKLEGALVTLQQSFDRREKDIVKEKNDLKDDITRLRGLITAEYALQNENNAKITELADKIAKCDHLPKDTVKDCGPIKVRIAKMETEMTILEARTDLIFKEVEKIMKENQSPE